MSSAGLDPEDYGVGPPRKRPPNRVVVIAIVVGAAVWVAATLAVWFWG